MKILLACNVGMSTSLVARKMQEYSDQHELGHMVQAVAFRDYAEHIQGFDVILLGPQVSYKLTQCQREAGCPVGVIPSMDYATGNAENIYRYLETILK